MKVDIEQVAQNVVSGMMLRGGVNFPSAVHVKKYAIEYGWDAEIDEFGPEGIEKRSDKQDDAINKRIAEIIAMGIPKSRSRRKIFFTSEDTGETLTEVQVDFLRCLVQVEGWDPKNSITTERVVDTIEGRFTDKPMMVGAAISTLCEKGILRTAIKREGKRNMKSIMLTDKGSVILGEVIK